MPRAPSLASLRSEARGCTCCPLHARATQTVFGEGGRARLLLVGEQPGDVEERAGRPFVGPAGRLLHELLAEAGVPEQDVYLTNAVKHFEWRPHGTRRIHDRPSWSEIRACSHCSASSSRPFARRSSSASAPPRRRRSSGARLASGRSAARSTSTRAVCRCS